VDIGVAPPFTALHPGAEAGRSSNVCIAAQNLYWSARRVHGQVTPR